MSTAVRVVVPRAPSRGVPPSPTSAPLSRRLLHPRLAGARVKPLASSSSDDATTTLSDDVPAEKVSFASHCHAVLGMSGADVDKVLSREPKLAGYDVERAVAPKTRFFTDALGVPAEKLRAAVKRDPRILVVSLASLSSAAAWLERTCGVTPGEAGAILCRAPSLAWADAERNLTPTVDFLVDELGVSPPALKALATRQPSVLLMSVDGNLREKTAYFSRAFEDDDAGSSARSGSSSSGSDFASGRARACAMIAKHPAVLALSVEKSVAPKVRFLAETCGMGSRRAFAVAEKAPAILSLSLERNIAPTFRFLSHELGLGTEQAAKVVEQRPMLLAYSLDKKIRPTVAYLVHEFFPRCDAREAVTLCNYSLKNRIVPRVRVMRRQKLMAQAGETPALSPAYVLSRTDADFVDLVGCRRDAYDAEVREAARDPSAGRLGYLDDERKAPKGAWTLELGREMAARAREARGEEEGGEQRTRV